MPYARHIDATWPVGRLVDLPPIVGLPPELRWLVGFVLYVLFAVASGVLFGVALEKPSLALRDRLFPARTRPPMGSPNTPFTGDVAQGVVPVH